MTKASDKQIFALLVILGLGILAVVYFFPLKNLKTEIEAVEAENDTLRAHVNELQVYYDGKEQYKSDTEILKKEITNLVSTYPSKYMTVDFIMEAVDVQENAELEFSSIAISEPTELTVISADTIRTAKMEEYQDQIGFYSQNVVYTNKLDYDNLKDAIRSIFASKYRINIKNITYTADAESGELSGSFSLGYYYVTGTGVEYVLPEIPEYEAGTKNIFGTFGDEEIEDGEDGDTVDGGATPTVGDDKTPVATDDKTPTAGDDKTPTADDDKTPTGGDDKTPTGGDDTPDDGGKGGLFPSTL